MGRRERRGHRRSVRDARVRTALPAQAPGASIPYQMVGWMLVDIDLPHRTTRVTVQGVPEGLLGIVTCRSCGTRREQLLRLAAPQTAIGPDPSFLGLPGERAARLAQDLASALVSHRCTDDQMPHGLATAHRRLLRVALDEIVRGRPLQPTIHVLAAGERRFAIPIDPLPAHRTLDRARIHAKRAYRLRCDLQARHISPFGVILLAEATETPEDEGTEAEVTSVDIIVSMVATPTAGWVGRAPLSRTESGRPCVGSWTWEPMSGPCLPIDGILAVI